jgi:small nuclear ribonucleoprotein G
MSKAHAPELKKFMDKKISLRINGGRQVLYTESCITGSAPDP